MKRLIEGIVHDAHSEAVEPLLADRDTAGHCLLNKIINHDIGSDTAIISVALGGIPVARPVWRHFQQRPQILPISKILADEDDSRFGIGAATSEALVYNHELIDFLRLSEKKVAYAGMQALHRLQAKTEPFARYLVDPERITESPILIIDDGVASGFTLQAGINSIKYSNKPSKIAIATPVIHDAAKETLEQCGNEVIALHTISGPGFIVDNYYEVFDQLTPGEAKVLLDDATR